MSGRQLCDSLLVFMGFLLFLACTNDDARLIGDPDFGGLAVPEGFDVIVVADSIGHARHLTVRDNGDIYVKLRSSDQQRGSVVALRDINHDGRADQIKRFGGQADEGNIYGAGMIIHDGYLYFSSATTVYRYKLTPGALIPEESIEIVLYDDHAHGEHWHITKPISFDQKGHMYVPFGSPSNACQDISATPNGVSGGIGLDPCPELEHHGGIWRFESHRIGLTQDDGIRIATGIRSVVAMDWNDADDHLYLVMHGRDNLYSLYPDRYTPWQSAVLPAEELIRVEEGDDYGWPYCYFDQLQNRKVLAPEYGGDGTIEGRCSTMQMPLMGFPGHWAPNDLLFYRGDQFPRRYRSGAFIAFHGSTNRAPYPQAGYFVAFVPFENGKPSGKWEVFADGFSGVDTIVNTSDAKFRPMGLAEGTDGSLYITESRQGKIWRILFRGDKGNFGENDLAAMELRKMLPHIKTPDEHADHLQKNLSEAQQLYNRFCGNCHQSDGKGALGRFPPLQGAKWVSGNKKELIELTLEGMQGPIEVLGQKYNAVMPAHHFLADDQIAKILTYIRREFGSNASAVEMHEVAQVRSSISR